MQQSQSHQEYRHTMQNTLVNFGLHNYAGTLRSNYKECGAEFGVDSFAEFVLLAREHLTNALKDDGYGDYTLVETANGGLALDYKFLARGVYTAKGKPLSFYKPRFLTLGYDSPQQELDEFMRAITFKSY